MKNIPTSNVEKEFVSYVVELMQTIGPVSAKTMFGGHGVFIDALMFALVFDNVLYLKADNNTVRDFKEKGLEAFTYNKKDKEFKMSYYQAPEEILDDIEEMNVWANKAYGVALRVASKKHKK